jgi:protein tyrosine phosphatase (PTP) superfamily phosphohydrolase (DUF442 family)
MRPGFRPVQMFAVALLAVAGLASAAQPVEKPKAVAGIVAPNVVVVTPNLVTAGQPDRESLLKLKAEGYAAVISLAPGNTADAVTDEGEILKAQGIEYVHVPIPWQSPETSHLEATAAALNRYKGRKVLVHCQMNMRASAVTFLYRVIYAKDDPAAAWADVKKVWTPKDQWAKFVDDQLRVNKIAFKAE